MAEQHYLFQHVPSVLLATAVAYLLGLMIFPVLMLPLRIQFLGVAGLMMGIIESPHLVAAESVSLRGIAALLCGDILFRTIDFVRQQHSTAPAATWGAYWRFLIPVPLLLVVFVDKQRRLSQYRPGREVIRVLLAGGGVAISLGITLATHRSQLIANYFLLDHLLKVALFVLVIESASQFLLGLERLVGFDPQPLVDRCYRSKTPAEFWIRYNQRMQRWLYLNVFLPSGGRRHGVRGIMVVFLVSAILHELMFGIATSRFDGYQAAFFLLQIPAVLVSYPLERWARPYGKPAAIFLWGCTAVWFAATSMLFLHGLHRVFPFVYAAEPWLP